MMPPSERAVYLSRIFAGGVKTDPEHFEPNVKDGEAFHEMTTPFSKLLDEDYYHHDVASSTGVLVPVLKELEVALVCKKEKVIEIDNHEVWIVSVHDIFIPNAALAGKKTGGLLYFDRGFHRVGPSLREN